MTLLDELRKKLARKCPARIEEDRSDEPIPTTDHSVMGRELEEFDWAGHKISIGPAIREKPYLMFQVSSSEKPFERKLRMLEQVKRACMACTMCELGRSGVSRDNKIFRDPHVFSTMNPTRIMVVGQNPGWNEVCQCEPFVGDAGANFNREVEANGLSRNDFYICNTVRCYTVDNERPTDKQAQRCKPFLDIEINLIRPQVIVALGSVAFGRLCPSLPFSEYLGKMVESVEYEAPVFAVYHPSPLNLEDPQRAVAFKKHMKLLCSIVKGLKK